MAISYKLEINDKLFQLISNKFLLFYLVYLNSFIWYELYQTKIFELNNALAQHALF